ncbi:hypothetical protein PCASD_06423 [Puccinia coronata f. sp. avenae]|uniref:Uncharacterized protein n=1 Tax=Puccinia coronata f. sp. avenae TaxID=200324 RepID=A0A2N5UFM3_9BASI|nr:hypothetical protein PCASD_06423 [Puccinia coronata f. sp. avenae]
MQWVKCQTTEGKGLQSYPTKEKRMLTETQGGEVLMTIDHLRTTFLTLSPQRHEVIGAQLRCRRGPPTTDLTESLLLRSSGKISSSHVAKLKLEQVRLRPPTTMASLLHTQSIFTGQLV